MECVNVCCPVHSHPYRILPPSLPLIPLNAELNPICHLLALLGAHHILHVSRIRVKPHFHFVHFLIFFSLSHVLLRFLTFYVLNISIFPPFSEVLYGEFLALLPNPRLDHHPLSTLLISLFSIFAATLISGPSAPSATSLRPPCS